VVEVNGQEITRYALHPRDVGVEPAGDPASERGCRGGTPDENAALTRAILQDAGPIGGGVGSAPRRTTSAELARINAGAAIYGGGKADTIAAGVDAAHAALADGSAARALERYIEASRRHALAEAPG